MEVRYKDHKFFVEALASVVRVTVEIPGGPVLHLDISPLEARRFAYGLLGAATTVDGCK
jgi:hypothetical protein